MNWLDPWYITLILTGLIFIIAGYLLYRFPPRKINSLYGYRTKASMANQKNWDFSQKYSGIEMIKTGAALMAISCVGLVIPVDDRIGVIIAIAILVLAVILMIRRIEKAIKSQE